MLDCTIFTLTLKSFKFYAIENLENICMYLVFPLNHQDFILFK